MISQIRLQAHLVIKIRFLSFEVLTIFILNGTSDEAAGVNALAVSPSSLIELTLLAMRTY